jgi:hypothetical protein
MMPSTRAAVTAPRPSMVSSSAALPAASGGRQARSASIR